MRHQRRDLTRDFDFADAFQKRYVLRAIMQMKGSPGPFRIDADSRRYRVVLRCAAPGDQGNRDDPAAAAEPLGAYCRFESSLDPRPRGLSLLIAARHWDAQYSWNAHVDKAVALGVSRESLTALVENREPDLARSDEDAAYRFSVEILRDHFVSAATFARTLDELGERGLVDLRRRQRVARRPPEGQHHRRRPRHWPRPYAPGLGLPYP
ncbi:hypothetical protein [Actinoallomurus sp. CA-142502]|uniref:hypothetical protein n=1 Tax=Actinoallomurus sp. CA-142502 TaxID=3239885 RepID=UPI003D918797